MSESSLMQVNAAERQLLSMRDRVHTRRGQAVNAESCHAVEPSDSDSSFDEVPSFTAIAALPTTTSSGLRALLSTPYGEMLDVKLTSDEMDVVVDYILSLKEKKQNAGQNSE
jgi:hypothetical protein